MTGPFDVSLKSLLQQYAADWLRIAGIHAEGSVALIESDLSTVAAEADKVFRIDRPSPKLAQVELQASYDPGLPDRSLLYNVMLTHREKLSVESVVVLLRPSADGPRMTGRVQRTTPDGVIYLDFRYRIVRLWEIPVEEVLTWGIGAMPIAPLARGADKRLGNVIHEIDRRFRGELDEAQAAVHWTVTEVLMGLKYSPDLCGQMIRGVQQMKESLVYQAILAEGRAEGRNEGRTEGRDEGIVALQKALMTVAEAKLGPADASVQQSVRAVRSIERLEELIEKSLRATSWDELLRP